MAGRKKAASPGRTELGRAVNELLSAAAKLDRIEAGAGDQLRHEAAMAVRSCVSRAVWQSESASASALPLRAYERGR